MRSLCFALFALVLTASLVHAEPLLTMSGGKPKPGIVTAWSSKGKKIELTLKSGVDAGEVAQTIEASIDRVKAKVKAGKVLVIGKTEAELLPALAEVDLGEPDLDELASAGEDDLDSGSSLRAKKTAKLNKLFKDRNTVAVGQVVKVGGKRFPHASISVRILRGPAGALGRQIRKGKTITFQPVFKMKGRQIDYSDENTQTNVGAWFLKAKDRVQIKIGKAKGKAFEAVVISR